jgi:hypothetical protein
MSRWYLIPLGLWATIVLLTLAVMVVIPPSGDPAMRPMHYIFIVLYGYFGGLVMAVLAWIGARGREGRSAALARKLPLVMLVLALAPLLLNTLIRVIFPSG